MTGRERSAALGRVLLWVGGAVLLASLLFAPVLGVGFCAAARVSGDGFCDVVSRSLVGIDTSLWLWLGATAVFAALAWWLARRPRRSS